MLGLVGAGIYGAVRVAQSGWVTVKSPDKRVSVRMPEEPEMFVHFLGASQGFRYEVKQEEQMFVFENLRSPSHLKGKSDDEIREEYFKSLSESKSWTNVVRSTVQGKPALTFDHAEQGYEYHSIDFWNGGKGYSMFYRYKTQEKPEDRDKYFKSVKISQ